MPRHVLILGGTGFLGRHVEVAFREAGWEATAVDREAGDLREPAEARSLIQSHYADAVIHLAAHCGGIGANQARPGDFFRDNILMGVNVLDACQRANVRRLVVAGTICAYPHTPPHIPFVEEDLWDGYPEPTNAAYGVAKKALAVMLDAYRQQYGLDGCYLMPTNLYGPGDSLDLRTNHVIPALIRKVLTAQEQGASSLTLWGTGQASRDFLYVRDAARAFVLAAEKKGVSGPLNLGSGLEVPIWGLAEMVASACRWKGEFLWDHSKPDGQPRRLLDSSKALAQLGWQATTSLEDGLRETVAWVQKRKLAA